MNEFRFFKNCVKVDIYLQFYPPTAQIQLHAYYATHWMFCVVLKVAKVSVVHGERTVRRPHCQKRHVFLRSFVNLKLPVTRGFHLKSVVFNVLPVTPIINNSAFDTATGDPCLFYNVLMK
jgi:hypothetical protein